MEHRVDVFTAMSVSVRSVMKNLHPMLLWAALIVAIMACGIATASGEAGKESAGQVTHEHINEIAKIKLKDLNTQDLKEAVKIIEGTARSMGIEVVEKIEKKEEEKKEEDGTEKEQA